MADDRWQMAEKTLPADFSVEIQKPAKMSLRIKVRPSAIDHRPSSLSHRFSVHLNHDQANYRSDSQQL
jgi:hypothetical protein